MVACTFFSLVCMDLHESAFGTCEEQYVNHLMMELRNFSMFADEIQYWLYVHLLAMMSGNLFKSIISGDATLPYDVSSPSLRPLHFLCTSDATRMPCPLFLFPKTAIRLDERID